MQEEIKILAKEFERISQKRWIKSISNNHGSIGMTFEKELKKSPDATYFPDYLGTEIKCTSRYSRYPLYLFTVAFDGPSFPEIDRIIDKYGKYDKTYTDKKVLFANLNYNKDELTDGRYKFRLQISQKEQKIYLCVFNNKNELIEKESYIYLDTIKHHLELKLNRLAVIHASIKTIEKEKYFRYYKIDIYNLISFERFIELLQEDEINIDLISRISKSGKDAGRYRNKNLVFSINKEKIEKLFKKIYSYNHDLY